MDNNKNVASLGILRYKNDELVEIEDQVGIESVINVKLENGKQMTLPCTALHLEELALGIAFSQNSGKGHAANRITPYFPISYEKIKSCFHEFAGASDLFKATGSVHSGQIMDENYQVVFFTEDMGRHNVVDKIIGFSLKNNIDFKNHILMISSRMPLELVEKAYKIGIRNIASVSAPTREAVLYARSKNMNLIGMFRDNRFNIYSK